MSPIHPAPAQFSSEQLSTDPILHFFHYAHLPAALQSSSAPFCGLAAHIVDTLPRNAERTVALRKLLEAKDAAVRANVGSAGLASGGRSDNFYDRLISERDDLQSRLTKLVDYLDGDGALLDPVHHEMLGQQKMAMTEYLAILNARIENLDQAGRMSTRRPPMEGLEDGTAVREVGKADIDRDGPVKFGD